ncbi:beta-alanyl-dopamine/carcinine hydrolase-like [Glandiceps talaboti]
MPPIPLVFVEGSHYEVGFQIGSTFKARIQETTAEVIEELKTILRQVGGKKLYDGYLEVVKKTYPQYVEELKGLADGANVEFDQILLTHSEDADRRCTNGYLVGVHIKSQDANTKEEKFISYCTPGELPGYTFGFNQHGVAMTCNTLVQKNYTDNAIVSSFVGRATLGASNLTEVVDVIKKSPGIASAFNFNVGVLAGSSDDDAIVYSIECANSETESLVNVAEYEGFDYHVNLFKRLQVEDGAIGTSSGHRQQRINEFKIPECSNDMLEIMSDTNNEDYPIHRGRSKQDSAVTAVVAMFDFKREILSLFKDNPKKTNYEPIRELSLRL